MKYMISIKVDTILIKLVESDVMLKCLITI
jgi:hypothetical protein